MRINDDKSLEKDDIISLCTTQGKEFAQAKIQWVKETRFKDLTPQDKQGHEKFSSDKEMYETYGFYYKTKVTPNTKVKVIKFKLVS